MSLDHQRRLAVAQLEELGWTWTGSRWQRPTEGGVPDDQILRLHRCLAELEAIEAAFDNYAEQRWPQVVRTR
jgi:hypothetical protein